MNEPKDPEAASAASVYSVVEVRMDGKLHDLVLEGPEHAVRNSLIAGSPYQEARVVENPHGYDFAFLEGLICPPNTQQCNEHERT